MPRGETKMSKAVARRTPMLSRAIIGWPRGLLGAALMAACSAGEAANPASPSQDAGNDVRAPSTAPKNVKCAKRCATDADCAGSAGDDTGNYACESGLCKPLGCKTDQDCESTFGPGHACRKSPNSALPGCPRTCVSASDCAVGVAWADSDNYVCDDGVCSWTGCRSDDECGPGSGCVLLDGHVLPVCETRCSTASDCVPGPGPLVGADNHVCDGNGYCRWLGCNTHAECEAALSAEYACPADPEFSAP